LPIVWVGLKCPEMSHAVACPAVIKPIIYYRNARAVGPPPCRIDGGFFSNNGSVAEIVPTHKQRLANLGPIYDQPLPSVVSPLARLASSEI